VRTNGNRQKCLVISMNLYSTAFFDDGDGATPPEPRSSLSGRRGGGVCTSRYPRVHELHKLDSHGLHKHGKVVLSIQFRHKGFDTLHRWLNAIHRIKVPRSDADVEAEFSLRLCCVYQCEDKAKSVVVYLFKVKS
jgi:hypothetical protein